MPEILTVVPRALCGEVTGRCRPSTTAPTVDASRDVVWSVEAVEALTKESGATRSAVAALRLFDAVLCAAKVVAFNLFKAHVVPRVGALHWSCKDFLFARFFSDRGEAKANSLVKEDDGEDFVAPDLLCVANNVEPRVRVVRASPEQSTFRGVPGTQSFFGGSATCHGRDAPQVWVGATQML